MTRVTQICDKCNQVLVGSVQTSPERKPHILKLSGSSMYKSLFYFVFVLKILFLLQWSDDNAKIFLPSTCHCAFVLINSRLCFSICQYQPSYLFPFVFAFTSFIIFIIRYLARETTTSSHWVAVCEIFVRKYQFLSTMYCTIVPIMKCTKYQAWVTVMSEPATTTVATEAFVWSQKLINVLSSAG